MKKCKKCGVKKSTRNFYSQKGMLDGTLNFCIDCVKVRVKKHRLKNIKRIRAYDKRRHSAQNMTKKQIEDRKERTKKWRKDDSRRQVAHNATMRKLKRPNKCEMCKKKVKPHGHHSDYAKPLKVIWCCPSCHSKIHQNKERCL